MAVQMFAVECLGKKCEKIFFANDLHYNNFNKMIQNSVYDILCENCRRLQMCHGQKKKMVSKLCICDVH